jgi:predicted  nucleic acid-binding Zn-ribbon protein
MPHQCVKCASLYPAGCQELLKGCECGSKFFFYVRKESLEKAKNVTKNLTTKEKDQMEKDVFEMIGQEKKEEPVVLDFESIHIKKPGQYEIDLIDLFKGKPLIYKLDEGKYMIDIVSTFESKTLKETSS